MKLINKSILILSIFSILFLGTAFPVFANSPLAANQADRVIFGDFTLASGKTNQGDLVVIGGNVTIEEDATVIGTMAIIGGNLTIHGSVMGDLVSVGGSGEISDTAYVEGSLVSIGSSLSISDDATILGETVFELDDSVQIPPVTIAPDTITPPQSPRVTISTSPGIEFLRKLFSTSFMVLALAALGLLIGILFPNHLKKTAKSIVHEPVKSGVLGLLTIFAAPIVLGILAITIILLPVSLITGLALSILMLYGWVAVGYEIGLRISISAKVAWEPSIIAGIGTLVLSATAALVNIIPCIGFLIYPIVVSVGLGGVLISQFGRKEIVPAPIPQITESPVESVQIPSEDENSL